MQNPDTRPLPAGWTQDYNPTYQTWFYVDLRCSPPKSTYQHPLDHPSSHPRSASSPNPSPALVAPRFSSATGQPSEAPAQPNAATNNNIYNHASQSPTTSLSPLGQQSASLTPQAYAYQSPVGGALQMPSMPQSQASHSLTQSTNPASRVINMQLSPPPAQTSISPTYTASTMPYMTAPSTAQLPTAMPYLTSPMSSPMSTVSPTGQVPFQPTAAASYPTSRKSSERVNIEKSLKKYGSIAGKVGMKVFKVAAKTAAKTVISQGGALATNVLTTTAVNSISGMSPGDAAAAALTSATQQNPAQGGPNYAQLLLGVMARSGDAQQIAPQGSDIAQMLAAMAQNGNTQTAQGPDITQMLLAATQNSNAQQTAQGPDITQMLLSAMAQNGNTQQPAPQGPDITQMLSNAIAQNGSAPQQPELQQGTPQAPDYMQMLLNAAAQAAQQPTPGQAAPQGPDFMQLLANAMAQNGSAAQQPAPMQAAPQGSSYAQMPSSLMAQDGPTAQPPTPQAPDFMQLPSGPVTQTSPTVQQPVPQDFQPSQILTSAAAHGGVTAPPQAPAAMPKLEQAPAPAPNQDHTQMPMSTMAQNGSLNQNAVSSGSPPPAYQDMAQLQNMQAQQNYFAAVTPYQQQQQQQQPQFLALLSSLPGADTPEKASAADVGAGDASATYMAQMQPYQQEQPALAAETTHYTIPMNVNPA